MPITETQLARRKNYIGSSDMAAILGLDPFRSAYDVWLTKVKDLEEEQSKQEHLQLGQDFESIILDRAEKAIGKKIKPNQFRSAKDAGLPFGSNIDGITEDGFPVEAKTSGVFWPVNETWGEEGTDEIPHRVIVQCHVHLICTERDMCYVPVLKWGLKQSLYICKLDVEIRDAIIEKGKQFWEVNVIGKVEPVDSLPSLDIIKRVKREPETSVQLTEEGLNLVAEWLAAKEQRLAMEKEEKSLAAQVVAKLNDTEAGYTDDNRMVTYLQQSRSSIDSTRFKAEMPQIAAQYTKKSVYRVLRIKKA